MFYKEFWLPTVFDFFKLTNAEYITIYLLNDINNRLVDLKSPDHTFYSIMTTSFDYKHSLDISVIDYINRLLKIAKKTSNDLWESIGLEFTDGISGIKISRDKMSMGFHLNLEVYQINPLDEPIECVCPRDVWMFKGCQCGCFQKEQAAKNIS